MPQKKNTGFIPPFLKITKSFKGRAGFTLVEMLTSIIIIALVAIASYTGFYVLSGGNEVSRNRLQAINLSQAALEEIRGVARSDFTGLANHYLNHINQPTQIPGFLRTINITPVPGTSNLQKAEVTISWQDKGQPRSYNTAILIAQPPQPLPANIYGDVVDATTGNRIPNAHVYLTHAATGHTADTTTSIAINCPLHPQHNPVSYHFCDDAGNFQLETGDWNLKVSCTAYFDSAVIPVPQLTSNEDRPMLPIQLQSKPEPATITGRFIDATDTTKAISGLAVYLRQNGDTAKRSTTTDTNGGFSFSGINFSDTNPQYFTVYSLEAYKKQYCGKGFRGPGGAEITPDTHISNPNYNYHGWSSSPVEKDGTVINSSNPWIGGAHPIDRIGVSPGETNDNDLKDIPLSPVPLATLNGTVRLCDECGNTAIEGARISVSWYDGTPWPSTATTDNLGQYRLSIPAQQELFPAGYLLTINCEKDFTWICCCNTTCSVSVPMTKTIDNVHNGDTKTENFIYQSPSSMELCGNADGYVKNNQTNTALAGVTVTISGSKITNSSGYYLFNCPTAGPHSIPTGSYSVTATKAGYYDFQSWGNWIYSNRGGINIQPNQKTTYETIRLWPGGFGTIQGQVLQQGTTTPIIGATVQLDYYQDGIDQTTTTDSSGRFVFTGVIETWPVPAVVGNSYYNQTSRRHSLKFTHPDYNETSRSNQTLNAGETLNLTIEMKLKSGI